MKTVVLLPIKLNNQRVPGKNIKKFSDGTPFDVANSASMPESKKC